MYNDQPKVSAEVMRFLNRVIKKEVAPLKVAGVRAYGMDSGWEGGPTIVVEVLYIGKSGDFDVKLLGGIWSAVLPKLDELGESRWPIFRFLPTEDTENVAA